MDNKYRPGFNVAQDIHGDIIFWYNVSETQMIPLSLEDVSNMVDKGIQEWVAKSEDKKEIDKERIQQMVGGFTDLMRGFWNNPNIEAPSVDKLIKADKENDNGDSD